MASDPTAYPDATIVFITDTIAGQGWQGSGVLIAPDEVLTASHVVYNSIAGEASDITVTPAYDAGYAPYGSATGTTIHYEAIQDQNETISNAQSQFDFAVIHLSRPFADLGTMGLEANFQGGPATVAGYPATMQGRLDVSHQSVTMDPSYSLLDGASIGAGSSGGPVWISGTDGAGYVVGLVSSEASDGSDTGYFTQITTSDYDQIESWVAEDEAASSNATLTSYDTTTASSLIPAVVPYTGPVAGLTSEYINITSDSLSVTALSDNWFIHSGSGTDAIAVLGGTNVLDGGTGSNFMTGGSGTDTFFLDDRAAAADIWSTIVNFHAGDDATLWGVTASDFSFLWANGQGAAGYHGLTLHATAAGKPEASLTLTGFTQTDLTNGRLSVSYGTDQASGSTYMMVHANT